MKYLGQGKQGLSASLKSIALPVILSVLLSSAVFAYEGNYCAASEAYLAELSKYLSSSSAEQKSTSCLVSYPAILPELPSYQVVDIQPPSLAPIEGAWQIPIFELRTKPFLKQKRLLLIGEGFSRAQASSDCDLLTKAGFQEVKMLIGGADIWRAAGLNKRKSASAPGPKPVTAKQLVLEYLNGRVIIVALSQTLAEQMTSLDLSTRYFPSRQVQKIIDLAVTESSNGLVPLVIVAEEDTSIDSRLTRLPNIYVLTDGPDAVRRYLSKVQWANHNRLGVPRRYMCGDA